MDDREIQSLLAFCHMSDIDSMVRVGHRDPNTLYRYMEDGASGLMLPLISSPAEAEQIVQAVKFPPLGNRGMDGAGLDGDYFLECGDAYTDDSNRETFLVAQIEMIEAVEQVEAIAAVEGIDALFIGWGDLSLRIRHHPDISWTLDEVADRVAAAAAANGIAWGGVTIKPEAARDWYDKGARLLVFTGEYISMMHALEAKSREIRETYPNR
jgi:2-keto-3-deoxy-L-rhamnonate aldolase RhmA